MKKIIAVREPMSLTVFMELNTFNGKRSSLHRGLELASQVPIRISKKSVLYLLGGYLPCIHRNVLNSTALSIFNLDKDEEFLSWYKMLSIEDSYGESLYEYEDLVGESRCAIA